MSTTVVESAVGAKEILATFPVMQQLRPHLRQEEYLETVQRMMQSGFKLAAASAEGVVRAVAGYRLSESLAWGRYMYVDDLVTDEAGRSHGYGKALFDWLRKEAVGAGCKELHLDSGVQRFGAHRFYLRERMDIIAYHFKLGLP